MLRRYLFLNDGRSYADKICLSNNYAQEFEPDINLKENRAVCLDILINMREKKQEHFVRCFEGN